MVKIYNHGTKEVGKLFKLVELCQIQQVQNVRVDSMECMYAGAYERRVAARWSVLLVNLRFVKLANAGFLIWQHTLYYVVVG